MTSDDSYFQNNIHDETYYLMRSYNEAVRNVSVKKFSVASK